MNWIDAVIVLTLVGMTYIAFQTGFIRQFVSVIGAIFAVALAGLFYDSFSEDVELAIENPETAEIVAFAVIFAAVVLASQLIALFLRQAAALLMLGLFDSLAGALFGLITALVVIEIALILAITYPSLGFLDDVEGSAIAPFFLDVIPFLKFILPDKFEVAIDAFNSTTDLP